LAKGGASAPLAPLVAPFQKIDKFSPACSQGRPRISFPLPKNSLSKYSLKIKFNVRFEKLIANFAYL